SLATAVRLITERGIELDDIGLRRPTLDEVFLALTGHAPDAAAPALEGAPE
ncbi:MAG: daunorubicin/doxorubicin resistance ABC transporter ATP-binding protein DrrA, partial [Ilumatobacteraceae bacterium]